MKRFLTTLNNIWNIEELRKRILLTIGLLAVYRFGAFIVLPGVDASKIQAQDAAEGAKDARADLASKPKSTNKDPNERVIIDPNAADDSAGISTGSGYGDDDDKDF